MSQRIVLVNPSGDELFSGVSIAQEADGRRHAFEAFEGFGEIEEPCPATKRSSHPASGLFPVVKRSSAPPAPVDDVFAATDERHEHDDRDENESDGEEACPETKRGQRAA